ncbi:DUF4870 domain-containing protein [Paenibacillus sp. TRM 82003]|nr:DUF4870 domain-containing protein [Paenibacillus sp. TRM 82003]
METRKILAALAYFSIFFMGFILPAVLYFVTNDRYVKDHAKAALLSHLIPIVCAIVAVVGALATGLLGASAGTDAAGVGSMIGIFLLFGATALITLVVTIWNVYKGIKVLL